MYIILYYDGDDPYTCSALFNISVVNSPLNDCQSHTSVGVVNFLVSIVTYTNYIMVYEAMELTYLYIIICTAEKFHRSCDSVNEDFEWSSGDFKKRFNERGRERECVERVSETKPMMIDYMNDSLFN